METTLPEYYYSTQPFIAWCLNHYFYDKTHYVFCGAPFYPYKTDNPASSNPYKIYARFYESFKDVDVFSPVITLYRQNLQLGVQSTIINNDSLQKTLIDICDKIELTFFFPIVYRIDMQKIEMNRKIVANSGTLGSNEFLIIDLQEDEFDILFADISQETSLDDTHFQLLLEFMSSEEALTILKARSE